MDRIDFNERAARFQARVAAEAQYECVACCDSGSEAVTDDEGVIRYRDCSVCTPAKTAKRHWALMQEWGIPKRLAESRFETLRPSPNLYAAYQQAQAFAAEPSGFLTLIGPPGVGKSHLAVAIGRAACGTTQPRFVEAIALLARLTSTFGLNGGRDRGGKSFDDLMHDFSTVGLLILDDLGAEHRTEFASRTLFLILQHRYNELLPTVITSNDTLDALGPRLQSRLCDLNGCRVAAMLGTDQRVRGVEGAQGTWEHGPWDMSGRGGAYHGATNILVCPTCNSRPCLAECPRQMWRAA